VSGLTAEMMAQRDLALLAVLLMMVMAPVAESQEGIGLMLLGDVGMLGSPVNDWLDQDLVIDYFEIPLAQKPLSETELERYTAIYFPRTLARLLELYDMIIVCEEEELFTRYTTSKQKMLMYEAVEKQGVALFNSVPNEDFEEAAWAGTTLAELMPHNYLGGFETLAAGFKVIIESQDALPPIFTPFAKLGIERYTGPWCRQLNPKIGSTIWAYTDPFKSAFFISWTAGKKGARTSNIASDLDEPWWGSSYRGMSSENPWGGDLFLNIVYWSVGKEPVTDVFLVHTVRRAIEDYLVLRSVTLALVDFIDAFGANVRPLEDELAEVSEGRSVARQMYYEQRYQETLDYVQGLFETMKKIEGRAMELKDRSFMWIYLSEWLAVTSTLFVAGFLAWTLMVRRRLYRDVSVTRGRR